MYNPRLAFADEPWWDGTYIFRGYGQWYDDKFWDGIGSLEVGGGAAQNGFMYTDCWLCARTPWVEWDISSNQFIRTATKITLSCDFTTELYHHVTGKLEIACGSYNGLNASYNLWHTDSGDDTRFSLYHAVDGRPEGGTQEESKVIVIDNEAGSGLHKDGAHVWTDYRAYPGSSYSVWLRRLPQDALHSFQLRAWFWNYYYYKKNWYYDRSDNPPIGYSSKWVEQRAKRIVIASDLAWSNRVLTISPATVADLELGVGRAGAGAGCHVYAKACSTARHWIALARSQDKVKGTYQLVPVCACGKSLALSQEGGGPRTDPTAARLAQVSSEDRAQAIWIHGSEDGQRLFADCSGMALDRVSATVDDGGSVQFHSNGYADGEWDNESHIWHLEDARFQTVDGQPFGLVGALEDDCVAVGEVLALPEAGEAFLPGGSQEASRGVQLDCRWVASDAVDDDVQGVPEIVGRACLEGGTWLSTQPAVNLIGAKGQGGPLVAMDLAMEGAGADAVSVKVASSQSWRDGSQVGGPIDAVKLELSQSLGLRFGVRYRCWTQGGGWSRWARDGEELSPGEPLHAFQARLEPRDVVAEGGVFSLQVDEGMRGKRLTCYVFAHTSIEDVSYRGAAVSRSVEVIDPFVAVRYFADGDRSPCWTERIAQGSPYSTSPQAAAAGAKPGCSAFECWFTDASCTQPFAEGTVLESGVVDLYGRNMARVSYDLVDSSRKLIESRECYADGLLKDKVDAEALLPSEQLVAYGATLSFSRRGSIWFEDFGRVREAPAVPGAFSDAGQSGSPAMTMKVTCDMVAYLAWRLPEYEGIWVS